MTFRVFSCFVSAMDVPHHNVCGRDFGETAFVCPRQVCQFRSSFVSHEKMHNHLGGCNDDFVRISAAQWIR